MAIFIWQDRYKVKVESIDEQHQKLVEILNELASSMSKGKGREVLDRILSDLIEYTQVHFKSEEDYFDAIDYPQAAQHIKEHQDLLNQVLAFKADFDSGKLNLTIDLMLFLKEWLLKHIKETDKELGKAINRCR